MKPESYVYIVASPSRTLYIGVTNNLERRISEHKQHLIPGFTSRYGVTRLVYMETYARMVDAIAREKQLKNWSRAKKISLIERENPSWIDLAREW